MPKSAAPLAGAADFGIGDRLTRPSPGDGGVSRLVPRGDSSPVISLGCAVVQSSGVNSTLYIRAFMQKRDAVKCFLVHCVGG